MLSVLKGIIRTAVLSLAMIIFAAGCSVSSDIIVHAPTVTEEGQYDGDRSYRLVRMECSDASATIYYTYDGSTPVKGSPIYSPSTYTNVQGEESSSVLVLAGSTVKARAYKNKVLSEVVTLTVSGDTEAPTITEKGVYGEDITYRLLEIGCNDTDVAVYYTTDGSTPSTGSTAYEPESYTDYFGEEFESILVPAGSEVKAVTYKEGVYSSLVTLTVTDVTPAPEVEDKGEYDEGGLRLIGLTCSDSSAVIYYTTDGEEPSSESTEYSPELNTAVSGDSLETIVLPAGTTVKAIAYRDGIPSEVSVHSIASYLSAPTVTDKGPYKFDSDYRLISLARNDSAATIYYTTNGDEPTTASYTYSPTTNEGSDGNMVQAVAVQVGTTLKVVAIKGNETSDVRTYQVSTPPAAPTFTDRGQYSEDRTYRLLQVSCSDYYADIHYTTDGSTPTVSSEKYNPDRFTDIFGSQYECIKVPAGTTVKAISRKNRISSTVTEYNIGSSVAAPTVTNKGQYSDDKTKWLVQIGSTDTSSTIYYTTNGNMPTVNSTRYSETANTNVSGTSHNSVRVTAGSTLKAVAYKDETYSDVVTFTVPSVTVMPTITDMGQYSGNRANRLIKLECSDSTATIYYTTDGTEPTTRSTRYSAGSYSNISGTSVSAVLVPAGSTLKAMAYKDGVYSTVRSYTVPSAITAPTVTDRGQYNADRSKWLVQLGSTDTSATIYYTTDGTNPTASSTRYSANSNTNVNGSSYNSMRVSAGSTLKAVAYKNGTYSDLTSFSVPSAVSTPSFTDRGQYSGDWSKWLVQIGCTDTSATIYYTTDRTEPTTSSSRYTAGSYTSVSGSSYSSIQVPAGSTMKAMAYKDGVYSAVATFSVPSAVSTPTVRVMGQYRYDNTKRLVQVSCSDSSATIYYTTDGNDPSTSSTRYSTNYLPNVSGDSYDSIIVAEGATLKVMAYKNGVYSPVTTYNVPSKPVAPTVTDRGQYGSDRSKWLVTLACSDSSATIYYTTDRTEPTTSSSRYTAGSYTSVSGSSYSSILVPAGSTLKAVAFKDDAYSDVYTYSVPSAIVTPTINDKGQYDSDRSYRLYIVTCSDSSATIYYTTNGTNPTTSSSRYSESTYKSVDGSNYSSIKVPAGSTLKVCAYKNGVYSPVTSYSVPSAISTPTIIDRGQYSGDSSYRLIQISCSDSSASIYYTTNGYTPTTSSNVYSTGYYSNTSGSYYYSMLVPVGTTLKAVAYSNVAYSSVYTYTVPISTPTVTDRGLYSGDSSYRLIQISCSNSSASIYYTTNGYTPTTSSNVYSTGYYSNTSGSYYYSILVPVGTTLKAVAYYNGAYSDVASYTVTTTSISINTNGQWQSYSSGLSSSSYYSYRSYSNKSVDSSTATMYLTISGYDTFTLYIRSYAESSYDYTIAYEADSNTIKSDTRTSNNTSSTSLSSYKRVDYTGLGGTSHTIRIVYRKDGSVSNGDDRGYLVIPKNQ